MGRLRECPFAFNHREPRLLESVVLKGEPARHARGTDACGKHRYPTRDASDAAIFRGELEVKWKEFLGTVEGKKRSDDPIMSMNKQCAISS
jgi:hypothetical protein